MVEDKIPQFAEDNDLARARAFWKENGKSLIFGVVLGLSGIVGYNFWTGYQQNQSDHASQLFDQIRTSSDTTATATIAQQLKTAFPKSTYAALGAFSLTRLLVEEGNLELAEKELDWVLQNISDTAIQHVARIRLSAIYLSLEKAERVITMNSKIDYGTFESRYQELMGDAYVQRNAEGDIDKARTAYQLSLDTLPESSDQSELLQLKLDNLGNG